MEELQARIRGYETMLEEARQSGGKEERIERLLKILEHLYEEKGLLLKGARRWSSRETSSINLNVIAVNDDVKLGPER